MENNNILLQVSSWWGLHNPGSTSLSVTTDKELIYQHSYYRLSKELEELGVPATKNTVIKKLNDDEFNSVIDFIENNIVGKEYVSQRIFDAGYDVYVIYKGKEYKIYNNIDWQNKTGLYNITKEFMDNLKER